MYNNVKIGEKSVPMLSLASVNVFYNQLFHEDPFIKQTEEVNQYDFYSKMGFIMAKYAELKKSSDMKRLTFDNYIEWLDQFEQMDYLTALPYIMMTYNSQSITEVESKKNEDQPSEE